jgi:hypothetical protein
LEKRVKIFAASAALEKDVRRAVFPKKNPAVLRLPDFFAARNKRFQVQAFYWALSTLSSFKSSSGMRIA